MSTKETPFLAPNDTEQYRTAQELIERSRPSEAYYVLLAISAIIIAAGLLLENTPIVVGGMLVAPVLTPLLAIALGLSIGAWPLVHDTGALLIRSAIVIVLFSMGMTIVLGINGGADLGVENSLRTAILYFVVATASGVAATFAWVRKELGEALPGVAIAVSLVPPLALVGIWGSVFDFEAMRFYFLLFLLNLFGIIIGSFSVFQLLKFYKAEDRIKLAVEKNGVEYEKEKEQKKAAAA